MAAIAGDLGFFGTCLLAELAAVFLALRSRAETGQVRAFLQVVDCHGFLRFGMADALKKKPARRTMCLGGEPAGTWVTQTLVI